MDTLCQPVKTGQKARENMLSNQGILPYPLRGVHVEWNWKGCPWTQLTFQTVPDWNHI